MLVGKTIEIVATTSLTSGDQVQVGDMFDVTVTDIDAGSAGTVISEGVISIPKQ
ncbi:capsid cement protein, partial [Salmonella enterica]|uniref:capsid cement protein n=1 Tax=Salmonella enterica TaxID=28901 RepID=UPI00122D8E6B